MMNFVCRPLGDIYRQMIKNHHKNRTNSVCKKDPKNVSIWNLALIPELCLSHTTGLQTILN